MHLQNIKVRVKQYPEGWAVEIQKTKWYGKKYWTHLISVSGIPDKPWYYSSYVVALEQAVKYFEWDLIIGTNENKLLENPQE